MEITSEMQIFTYGEIPVRTVLMDGEPWWVLADVCRVLYLSNPSKVAERLDDDEKMTLTLSEGHSGQRGGAQKAIIVNEFGLYNVILRSDKPEAKAFTRWVTHEVLPSIRQTGQYAVKDHCLPTAEHPVAFEQKDLSKIRLNWFNYMLTALERKLGLTKDNMLHQSYESMKSEGTNVDLLKEHYIEATGRVDCSTFEAVCSDRAAALELSSILCRNMEITFIKRCM